MGRVIVCGFYTEDYRHWVGPLVASLDRLNQAHDFVLAEKAGQMWETNTMAKARHILAAMDRHPDKLIVWLDVDCIVHGDLSPLADIRGDVAFRMHSKFRRHHKGARGAPTKIPDCGFALHKRRRACSLSLRNLV